MRKLSIVLAVVLLLSGSSAASDCNPGHKDHPTGKDPSPPKNAPPPGGYNPKV